jgi:cytochrome c-type biogenesis protein CcmF
VPWRIDVTALAAAAMALIAAWLGPFSATPADWLARAPSQGMNAHLMKVWMLLHAPLVLAAYAWTLALAAPALAALGGELVQWPRDARAHARRAWTLLTAGIGFGMVWAFEDAMYGLVWHWDPVQTAVFVVWCLLGAHLHGIGGWRAGRPFWRWMPVTALLAAVLTLIAMGVTRHEALASSHRYLGATAAPAYFALAGALAVAGGAMWVRGHGRVVPALAQLGVAVWGLRLTQVAFVVLALFAAGHLAWAFHAGTQELPRPDEMKPFYATLSNWARGSELPGLRMAFARWDVDGYALARAALYPLIALGLVGGWFFLRRISRRLGRTSLLLATLACGGLWLEGGLLTHAYAGTGVLSQRIVAVLPRIDAALGAGAYLALGAVVWSIRSAGRATTAKVFVLAQGLVHLGAMLALWGALLSTALNGYSQHIIEQSDEWRRDHHGYAFRVTSLDVDRSADGGVTGGQGSFRALAQVELQTPLQRVVGGQTLYRDARSAVEGYCGPVRQICEILDYRYARYANQPGYVLHPFIDRGWTRDVQLWVSTAAAVAALQGSTEPSQKTVVVLRFFPFISLLWIGLALTTVGASCLALRPREIRSEESA